MGARDDTWVDWWAERLESKEGLSATPDPTEFTANMPEPTPERWHVVLSGVYQRRDFTGPSYVDASWCMELNPGATRYNLLKQCKKQAAEGAGIPVSDLAVLFFSCERDELT
jgi:hypothetical protein